MQTALRHGAFRRIATMYAAEQFLGWMASIALMVECYGATNSALGAGGMLLCRQVLPGVVVGLLGARLDRVPLQRSLAAGFLVQAAALLALGVAGYGAWLFPLAVVSGIAGSVGRSSLRASTARSLDGDAFRGANAVLNLVSGLSAPIAPGLAAMLVGAFGTGAVLAGAGFLCAFLVAPCLGLRVADAAPEAAGNEAPEAVSASATQATGLRPLLLLVGAVACLAAMDEPALLAYAEHELDAGVGGYGAIFMAWGLGMTLGSVVFTRLLGRSMTGLFGAAMAAAGVAYLGLGIAPSIAAALIFAVAGGVGNGIAWVAVVTAVQEATPAGREGWAASRLEAIAMAAPGVGIAAGSITAELLGPRAALLIPGLAILLLLAAFFGVARLRAAAPRRVGRPHFSPSIEGGSA